MHLKIQVIIVGRCYSIVDANVFSCVVVVWTHRGRSVPQVYTERNERPWVTLNLCDPELVCNESVNISRGRGPSINHIIIMDVSKPGRVSV